MYVPSQVYKSHQDLGFDPLVGQLDNLMVGTRQTTYKISRLVPNMFVLKTYKENQPKQNRQGILETQYNVLEYLDLYRAVLQHLALVGKCSNLVASLLQRVLLKHFDHPLSKA
jgi:hypothetical protein